MVFNSGELTLVEYGRNEILGSLRTEQTSSHLISVRLSDGRDPTRLDQQIRKVAYLIDLNTIRTNPKSNPNPNPNQVSHLRKESAAHARRSTLQQAEIETTQQQATRAQAEL